MTNRELQNIVERIKKNEKTDLTEIAASVGKDRSYLSKLINSEDEKEITKALLRNFKEAYPSYFAEDNKNNGRLKGESGDSLTPPQLATLLTNLMQKQNQLMEMQNKILTEQKEDLIDKVKEIHLNSKSTIAYLQTILRVNRADDSVIMDNQDLQAGREIGSSAIQAGNLELAAAKHLRKKDRKNQGGVGK